MLTTLLRIHTTARRHCEAARRQQARVTAGGPSFDDRTRAGAEKFGPNQPPHRLHAPARSPPRHREVPEGGLHWRSSFRCRSLRCATHSTVHAKNAKSVLQRIEPTATCTKTVRSTYWTKTIWNTRGLSGNDIERVRNETHVPRYPGYCEYSEYPPSEGQSHPGRPGPLRAWVGAPRPGPSVSPSVGGRWSVHTAPTWEEFVPCQSDRAGRGAPAAYRPPQTP